MVIYNQDKFRAISQLFLLIALIIYFIVVYILKRKKIEITYNIALKLFIIILLPIIAFPFIFLSTLSLTDKIIATIIAFSGCLLQFYGTKKFHEIRNKLRNKGN